MVSRASLTEAQVVEAFHNILQTGLQEARDARLLDEETLNSVSKDTQVTGASLCLFLAAVKADMNCSIIVPDPRDPSSTFELSPYTCPPVFAEFFNVWLRCVPVVHQLNPDAQQELARILCDLEPTMNPIDVRIVRLAAQLRSLALEISQRSSFQSRFVQDVNKTLNHHENETSTINSSQQQHAGIDMKGAFVPPPDYHSNGHPKPDPYANNNHNNVAHPPPPPPLFDYSNQQYQQQQPKQEHQQQQQQQQQQYYNQYQQYPQQQDTRQPPPSPQQQQQQQYYQQQPTQQQQYYQQHPQQQQYYQQQQPYYHQQQQQQQSQQEYYQQYQQQPQQAYYQPQQQQQYDHYQQQPPQQNYYSQPQPPQPPPQAPSIEVSPPSRTPTVTARKPPESAELIAIRETIYSCLLDVFSNPQYEDYLHQLLRNDPSRGYFASIALAIYTFALTPNSLSSDMRLRLVNVSNSSTSTTTNSTVPSPVADEYRLVGVADCPEPYRPLFSGICEVIRQIVALRDEDDTDALTRLQQEDEQASNDLAIVSRLDKLRDRLFANHLAQPDSPGGKIDQIANSVSRLALGLCSQPSFIERQNEVFKVIAGL